MIKVGVVGSISTDFVIECERRPQPGETVFGQHFSTSFGGKGANQAVASARLGADTYMVGAVGADDFGQRLIANLKAQAVNTDHVSIVNGVPSGVASITIAEQDNAIIYVAGANDAVTATDIRAVAQLIADLDIVIVQNETPQDAVTALIDLCAASPTKLILNPAPARALGTDYIEKVDYLTPNETEFAVLFPGQDMQAVAAQYPNKLIVTLGAQGAVFHDGSQFVEVPAYPVAKIVDTTGAGDTFNGALAVAIASGLPVADSIGFANLAGSLSVQKAGAQTGSPTLEEMKGSVHYQEAWHIK